MMNVDQITSRLAKLPDQALQQYAAMHKNDPYVLSLAVAESNRRKQMRQAVQGAQGGQEQPKVADQAVADMSPEQLPENQGIARLPAGEMNFADGGIVAFAGGGDVEHYELGGTTSALSRFLQATGQLSAYINGTPAEKAALQQAAQAAMQGPLPQAGGAAPAAAPAAQAAAKAVPVGSAILRNSVLGAIPYFGLKATEEAAGTLRSATPEQRAQFYSNPMMGALSGDAGLAAAIMNQGSETEAREAPKREAAATKKAVSAMEAERAKNMALANSEGFTRGAMANDPRLLGSTPAAQSVGTSAFQRSNPTTSGADSAAAPRAPGAAPQAGGFDMSPKGLMALREKLGQDVQVKEPEDLRAAREALTAEKVNAARENKAAIERSQAKFADAFKGREERLTKREEELGKQKDTNTGLAFLNAGLAIMSTPGGLAQAIGKGARVGTEQYAAGLEKLQAAKDKLSEARDRLDDLKLNRDMMNDKELRDAEAGIRSAAIEGRERGVDALKDMFNISNKRADSMFSTLAETGLTMYREQQANARNAATVGAQRNSIEQQVFPALVKKHNGNVAAAYQELITTKQDPKTDSSLVMEYAKNPAQLKLLEQTNPALAAAINARIQNMMLQDKPTGPVRP